MNVFGVLFTIYVLGVLVLGAIKLRSIFRGKSQYSMRDLVNVVTWPVAVTTPERREEMFPN